MLMPSFAVTTLKGIALASVIALLSACGANEDTEQSQDTSPDSFTFAPVTNAAPGTEVMSNEIVVSGINAPTPISISGGSYAVADSSYTSAAGTVTSGQVVKVKIGAPLKPSEAAEAVLTIGDVSAKFVVKTAIDLSTSSVSRSSSRAASSVISSVVSSTARSTSSLNASSRNPSNSSAATSVVIVVPGSSMPAASSAPRSSVSSAKSIASSARSSSVTSSNVTSSSVASSKAVSTQWQLDSTASYLNFVSAKNTHTLEVNHFTDISGDISSGVATLSINLNSANSGIALRDQRLRDLLFETMNFPAATVTVNLSDGLPAGLAVGTQVEQEITAELDLHGVKKALTARLSIQKLSSSRVVVQTIAPVLLKTSDYALSDGVEALRAAVGIASISSAVPVDFTLVFDAR